MGNQKHNLIFYLISVTTLATIAIQFYWNYKNYEQNKQQALNEIQLSLDNAIDVYYTDLSKQTHLSIIQPKKDNGTINEESRKMLKTFLSPVKEKLQQVLKAKDSIDSKVEIASLEVTADNYGEFKKMNNKFIDSITNLIDKEDSLKKISVIKTKKRTIKHPGKNLVFRGREALDSLNRIKGLSTILFSISYDSIDYKTVDSIIKKDLRKKNIDITYAFQLFRKDTLFSEFKTSKNIKNSQIIEAKSTLLGHDKQFKMVFSNPTQEALERSTTGILLSLLLSLAVISSLFYLLKIINKQKQLAEIKNDLISNITHEFKTPITTVSTALEAIGNFNVIDDKEKTKSYVSISKNQIDKLHLMVEKLLETATLDSEKLLLKKEEVNLIELIEKLTKKHQLISSEKVVSFHNDTNKISTHIDVFHFENAVSNLIDNAIKYGGNKISINLFSEKNNIKLEVEDNGKGIEKAQQEKVFDKFYRIPKGNTHDVKGFGIGLYYTKKIIEKHGGNISLKSKPNLTIFTILLPNEH